MSDTTATSLEYILRRHGDDLYRLAITLTATPAEADEAFVRLFRRLRQTPPADARAVALALIDHLPAERPTVRPRPAPAWTRPVDEDGNSAALLGAIARLPRAQRLALGIAALRSFEPEQDAPPTPTATTWRANARDALLALAPAIDPDLDPLLFDLEQASDDCRTARQALFLGEAVARADPLVRGHLALCEECRLVARDWRKLAARAEEALRDALRLVRLPEEVASRALIAGAPDTRPFAQRVIASRWVRLAVLPLAVIGLVALLVWPRDRVEPLPTAPVVEVPLRELVERANQTLYVAPPGDGIWRGSYMIRWTFADETYANLRGDIWIDRQTRGQHRMQLVHQQGGGPYEFQLSDRRNLAWYAVTPAYGATLAAPLDRSAPLRVEFPADPALQERLLQARLSSGAWSLARRYLAQASSAELRSWGRRQADNGAQLEIVGFRGVSLLSMPPGNSTADNDEATILLTIDPVTGALREIRELIGPAEGEQVSRTIWVFDGGGRVNATEETALFGIAFAWNGEGNFASQEAIATPEYPLITAERLTKLERIIFWTVLLPDPPPAATTALLISGTQPLAGDGALDMRYTVVYSAPGRYLTLETVPMGGGQINLPSGSDVEHTFVGVYALQIEPLPAWRYRGLLDLTPLQPGYALEIRAQGYSRAELLATLATLDVMTPERYREQADLFVGGSAETRAAIDALLAVVEDQPTPRRGMLLNSVARYYRLREAHSPVLADPYHRPEDGGRPQELIIERWSRPRDPAGRVVFVEERRDASGQVFDRWYAGYDVAWRYDAPASEVTRLIPMTAPQVNESVYWVVVRLLNCPTGELTLEPGPGMTITLTEPWPAGGSGCMECGITGPGPLGTCERVTSAGDRSVDDLLITRVILGVDRRLERIELRLGNADGTLLESWEPISEQVIAEADAPVGIFDSTPPVSFAVSDSTGRPVIIWQWDTLTLEAAQQWLGAQLFVPERFERRTTTVEAVRDPAPVMVEMSSVFDGAVQTGVAVRLSYILPVDGGNGGALWTPIYQGPADRFGAYLRARAEWNTSMPERFIVGEREIVGWSVQIDRSMRWALLELDGTLVAMPMDDEVQRAALAELRPVSR